MSRIDLATLGDDGKLDPAQRPSAADLAAAPLPPSALDGKPVKWNNTTKAWEDATSAIQALGNGTSVLPGVGSYGLDGQGRVITDVDGTTYTYDDANGGRVATVGKGGTTRTAQYDGSGNLTGWA